MKRMSSAVPAQYAADTPVADDLSISAKPSHVPSDSMSARERFTTGIELALLRFREYLQFDARLLHRIAAALVGWTATLLLATRQYERAFRLLAKFHRGAYSKRLTSRTERMIRDAFAARDPRFFAMLDRHIAAVQMMPESANFWRDPRNMLGSAALVLKSPANGEKGVILLWYNHLFPLFARCFDVAEIVKQYHVVLEPTWSGYCDLNILCFCRYSAPVFVEANEPYDAAFLNAICTNLMRVPGSSNAWVDNRRLKPFHDTTKDIDVVMVAGWGAYKRHHRFFAALKQARSRGRRLRVLLLGYPIGWDKSRILRHARYYGVVDQIEIQENVPYSQMNGHLNRATLCVLWSRREGVNRAIVEAMHAGLPCVIRAGFNYGHPYAYINHLTGRLVAESDLPRVLRDLPNDYDADAVRSWVMENLSCEVTARALEDSIAANNGTPVEAWRGTIAIKVNELHSMEYFDIDQRADFSNDYDYLRTVLIQPGQNPACSPAASPGSMAFLNASLRERPSLGG
jgi:glycosyltransferase involved in cell wall biosynthesis